MTLRSNERRSCEVDLGSSGREKTPTRGLPRSARRTTGGGWFGAGLAGSGSFAAWTHLYGSPPRTRCLATGRGRRAAAVESLHALVREPNRSWALRRRSRTGPRDRLAGGGGPRVLPVERDVQLLPSLAGGADNLWAQRDVLPLTQDVRRRLRAAPRRTNERGRPIQPAMVEGRDQMIVYAALVQRAAHLLEVQIGNVFGESPTGNDPRLRESPLAVQTRLLETSRHARRGYWGGGWSPHAILLAGPDVQPRAWRNQDRSFSRHFVTLYHRGEWRRAMVRGYDVVEGPVELGSSIFLFTTHFVYRVLGPWSTRTPEAPNEDG